MTDKFSANFRFSYSTSSKTSSSKQQNSLAVSVPALLTTAAVSTIFNLPKSTIQQRFNITDATRTLSALPQIPTLSEGVFANQQLPPEAKPSSTFSFNSSSSIGALNNITFSKTFSSRQPRGAFNQPSFNEQEFCAPKLTPKKCFNSSCEDDYCKPPKTEEEVIESSGDEGDESSRDEGDTSSVEDLEDAFQDELKRNNELTKNKRNKIDSFKETRQKWDADSLKHYSQSISIAEFSEISRQGCNSECSFDKKCLTYVDLLEMQDLKESFWGKASQSSYLPKKRKEQIQDIFNTCRANQHESTNKLTFQIRDKFGKKRRICEAAFLFQLGYIRGRDASHANSMWRAYKRFHFDGGMKDVNILIEAGRKDGRKKSLKFMDCELFIRKSISLYGDTMPTAEGTNDDGNPVWVLPYETVKSFFEEYKFDAELNRTDPSQVGKFAVFRKAFKSLDKEIRLLGCKGSLPTCSVCNTAHEMMRNKLAWSEQQRKIVLQFLRLHLKQQQTERLRLEKVKKMCAEDFDANGMPKYAFIYSDAMTESRGDCPKKGKKRHSTPGKVIKNRLFAVQVVSGPIDAILYISVDQTIAGGANLAVEIQRIAIAELTKMLGKVRMVLPRTQFWQFDNCGENKNRIMFCYASLLVEGGFAAEVNLSFLIVGHTHCNLDQNFSVLAKKIEDAVFIGSPLALHELYSIAHTKERHRPKLNIQLRYVYDWKTHFKDIANTEIKYFQVPHRFRITLSKQYNRAICQYMLFTPEDLVTESWLPKIPPTDSHEESYLPEEFLACSVKLHELAVVNGLPDFESYLGLKGDISKLTAKARTTSDTSNSLSAYFDMLPTLIDMEKTALASQFSAFSIQEDGGEDGNSILGSKKRMLRLKAELQRDMLRSNTEHYGYLIWLDYSRVESTEYDLLSRPRILPYIPADSIKSDDPRCKKLIEAAKAISSVSTAMIYDWTHNLIDKDRNMGRSIIDSTNDFQREVLHLKEKIWYDERKTFEDVINIIRNVQEMELEKPWLLMEPSSIAKEIRISEDTKKLLEQRMEMINVCRLKMIRKRQHALPSDEILSRQGRMDSTPVPTKCIFGFSLDKDGCLEQTEYTCEECGAICCALHKAHSTHAEFTNSDANLVLRQQIAASATISNITTAAGRTTASSSGKSGASQTSRRNSRPDLDQRFLAITGRQTLDSRHKKLKVAEYRAVIESLERKTTPEVPATTSSTENSTVNRSALAANVPLLVVPTVVSNSLPAISLPSTELSSSEQLITALLLSLVQKNPSMLNMLQLGASSMPADTFNSSVAIDDTLIQDGGNDSDPDDNTFE